MSRSVSFVFPWVGILDDEDISEFLTDVQKAIDAQDVYGSLTKIDDLVYGWRNTARSMSDPTRREVLTGDFKREDFVDAPRPE